MQLNCFNFRLKNSGKGIRVTEIAKKITLKGVWQELEPKEYFKRQPVTKYFRLTLDFVCSRALRESLISVVQEIFASIN